jgi:dephospho-CoA kinase
VEAAVILTAGLTGGIASGKSTIARHLASLGCHVIDADAIVSRLYRRGAAGHDAIVREYGREVLRADGEIDRPKLAAIAFASPESAKKLNDLIHPLVVGEQAREIASEAERFPDRDRIIITEATLMIESGGRFRFDRIVVVDSDPALQIERAVRRGMDRDDVERRLERQLPREERLQHADYVIDNRGDARALEVAAHELYEKLLADLKAKKNAPPAKAGRPLPETR